MRERLDGNTGARGDGRILSNASVYQGGVRQFKVQRGRSRASLVMKLYFGRVEL
jgi:hypothetical protein